MFSHNRQGLFSILMTEMFDLSFVFWRKARRARMLSCGDKAHRWEKGPCQHSVWSVREINMLKYVHTKSTQRFTWWGRPRVPGRAWFLRQGRERIRFNNEIYIPTLATTYYNVGYARALHGWDSIMSSFGHGPHFWSYTFSSIARICEWLLRF